MLIKCPECGKEISDKAISCPNCGCPSEVWMAADADAGQKPIKASPEDDAIYSDMVAVIAERMYGRERSTAMATALHKMHPETSIDEAKVRIDTWFKTHKDALRMLPKYYKQLSMRWDEIDGIEEIIATYNYDPNEKIKMIHALKVKRPEVNLENANDAITDWFYAHIDSFMSLKEKAENSVNYQEQYQIHCPRCRGTNVSFYFEENYIPGKTEVKYSLNLNPFKPFTIFNEKEKVKKKPKTIRTKKTICNTCGYIW